MKYIMLYVEIKDTGQELMFPIIFPDRITHSVMAEHAAMALRMEYGGLGVLIIPTSAGRVTFEPHVETHGHSESLGLASHSLDYEIIEYHDITDNPYVVSSRELADHVEKIKQAGKSRRGEVRNSRT